MSEETRNTFDLTPTWQAIMPALFHAIQHGDDQARRIAKDELTRLARLVDNANERN